MNFIKYLFIYMLGILLVGGCTKLDYKEKEFYKQEAYIISSESTSATERDITALQVHSFIDTIKYRNLNYDSDTLIDDKPFTAQVKFKIGIGGTLPAAEDLSIVVGFDGEALQDYNILKNTDKYIPASTLYSTNIPFNEQEKGFVVHIPKGAASSSLIFNVPILRDSIAKYDRFAFPVKVIRADKVPLSRQYTTFLVAGLQADIGTVVNWSGLPAPTFAYGTVQNSSFDNFYDPRLRQLTIHYKNVIGNDYTDVLTFVSPEFTLDTYRAGGGTAPQSWEQVRARGYKYWLPL